MHSRVLVAFTVITLSLIMIQTAQLTQAQSGTSIQPWALSMQIQNAQNITTDTFSPYDQVLLSANVTYNNASQPNILVTFKVQGPASTTNITQTAVTNAQGIAASSFRLPTQAQSQDSLTGTWQASATIHTTNATVQENTTFTTQWNTEITTINIFNSQNQNQTIFQPYQNLTTVLTIKSPSSLSSNITIIIKDSTGNIIGQTRIAKTLENSAQTQVQYSLMIPNSTFNGEATVNAVVYSGTYQNIDIPVSGNKTAYFTIAGAGVPTPTPDLLPPPIENVVSLFSWVLVATGFFTFTLLYIFLKRKPMPRINTQIPITTQIMSTQPLTPSPAQPTTKEPMVPSASITAKIAPAKTMKTTTIDQLPSIYETLGLARAEPKDDSEPSSQPLKQTIVDHLTRISSIGRRVQNLEAELKIEKEQLNSEVTDLNKILEEQERAVKNYFDSMRQEIAKLNANINHTEPTAMQEKKPDQPGAEKTEENND